MATKNYSESDAGPMPGLPSDIGLSDSPAIMKKVNSRSGSQRVPRGTPAKSTKKPAPKNLLQRGGTSTRNSATRKSPSTASTGIVPKAAQGTTEDAMMAAAKRLLKK